NKDTPWFRHEIVIYPWPASVLCHLAVTSRTAVIMLFITDARLAL
ncbi:hypothetical protein INT43_007841, partial [Umbelopsis isabellina]